MGISIRMNPSAKTSFIENALTKLKAGITQNSTEKKQENPEQYSYLNDMAFLKNEQKNLENCEKAIFVFFQKRIKRWSYFVLILSAYSLLNVFIGFSSAPFYAIDVKCSRFDPTEKC